MTEIIDQNDPVESRLRELSEDLGEMAKLVHDSDRGNTRLKDHLLVAHSRLRTGLEQRQQENERERTRQPASV